MIMFEDPVKNEDYKAFRDGLPGAALRFWWTIIGPFLLLALWTLLWLAEGVYVLRNIISKKGLITKKPGRR